jgi:disulfide bond formation protein DsbB
MVSEYIVNLLVVLTVIGNIFVLLTLLRIIFRSFLKGMSKEISKHNLLLAFIVSLTATSGSLFFSEVLGYVPCELCWFQRIFMYPLPIIFLVALLRQDRNVRRYALPLSVIGAIIAAYHYTIQRLSIQTACDASGPSCMTVEMFRLGYITIPMMALTAFIMIFLLLTAYQKR